MIRLILSVVLKIGIHYTENVKETSLIALSSI